VSQGATVNRTFLVNADLRSASFLATSASARGHWIALQAYCSERENSGILKGAKAFSPTEWTMTLGRGGGLGAVDRLVTAGLAMWEGNDLHLTGYDLASERRYQERRAHAAESGRVKAARDREKRERGEAGDFRDVGSGNSSASGIARATGNQSEESESLGRVREATKGTASRRSVESSGPPSAPRDSDEGVKLFGVLYEKETGLPYRPNPIDTMAMRLRWSEVEPDELPERMAAFLGSPGEEAATVPGFLSWHLGKP
jgi:hypothetical protein